MDFHFVRNFVQEEVLRVTHVSSNNQLVADALTKSILGPHLHDLYTKIGLASKIVLLGRDKD